MTRPLSISRASADEGVLLGADTPGAVPNRYIVTLKDQRAPAHDRARTLAHTYGGTVRFTYSHALKGFSVDISEPEARKLAADPAVRSVEQVGTARIAGTQTDPPWGLDRTDQRDLRARLPGQRAVGRDPRGHRLGVTYALAAGNNGSDACGFTPARVTEAITVGNSTRTDDRYTVPAPATAGVASTSSVPVRASSPRPT